MKNRRVIVAALLICVLISIIGMNSTSTPKTVTSSVNRSPSPMGQRSGSGQPMNTSESVNAYNSSGLDTSNALINNYTTGYLDNFTVQFPTNYTAIWQNITFSDMVAQTSYVTIQDGSSTGGLKIGTQGFLQSMFLKVGINFTLSYKANLTTVWLRYGAFNNDTQVPPIIPLEIQTDSATHKPSETVLASGNLDNSAAEGWHAIQVSASGLTLDANTPYWIIMNMTGQDRYNGAYYRWYYRPDASAPAYDDSCVAVKPAASWMVENQLFTAINLMTVIVVTEIDDLGNTKTYSSPTEVGMMVNGTPITSSPFSVDVSKTFFNFTTDRSVTFVANWTAHFDYNFGITASISFIARQGYTTWNASIPVINSKPATPTCTWYNLTFMLQAIPGNWSRTSPPVNITNTHGYGSLFSCALDHYLITATNNINTQTWANSWLITSNSPYKPLVSAPSEQIWSFQFTTTIDPTWYSPLSCNISFIRGTAIDYTINTTITEPYSLTISLNSCTTYKISVFAKWIAGNEASFDESTEINIVPEAFLSDTSFIERVRTNENPVLTTNITYYGTATSWSYSFNSSYAIVSATLYRARTGGSYSVSVTKFLTTYTLAWSITASATETTDKITYIIVGPQSSVGYPTTTGENISYPVTATSDYDFADVQILVPVDTSRFKNWVIETTTPYSNISIVDGKIAISGVNFATGTTYHFTVIGTRIYGIEIQSSQIITAFLTAFAALLICELFLRRRYGRKVWVLPPALGLIVFVLYLFTLGAPAAMTIIGDAYSSFAAGVSGQYGGDASGIAIVAIAVLLMVPVVFFAFKYATRHTKGE